MAGEYIFRDCVYPKIFLFYVQNSGLYRIFLWHLEILLHCLLGSSIAVEKFKAILISDPLYVTCFVLFVSLSLEAR